MILDAKTTGTLMGAIINALRPLYERMDKLTANEQKPLEATENTPQADANTDANTEAKPEVPDFSKLYARLKKQGKYEPKYI